MKLVRRGLLLLVVLGAAYLLFWPVPLEPEKWEPSPNPGLTGAFAPNTLLGDAAHLQLPEGADGPEDFAVLGDGIYTSDVNGGLFRLDGDQFTKVADLGGRPLGLDEGPDGALYIADSYRGVMRWSEDEGLTPLVTDINGDPVIYANQLDVARDGTIYFSNSTNRFDPETMGGTKPTSVMAIFEQSRTGYVARRLPDGTVEKIAEGFVYTNGVVLAPDESHLLIADSGRASIHKLWLNGEKEGQLEPFLTGLPGYPDNLEPGADGTIWVAFASPRVPVEAVMPYPFLRKIIWRLGPLVRPGPIEHGMVAQYDSDGTVLRVLQDAEGALGITTGARMIGDHLYVSMLEGPIAVRLPLDALP
ncbi:SMP-30/gluconolactonase/LRE family protein [uncultured Tateyamaria sp.]|uniref:SMP-30/gluconolactonase/LRE family protein n=1 Tax=uncultured Tateyamaria sp. TaxID=455651 RepID=UPI002634AC44|nr:SMP-30/gluconolactonase/LRE family protein [uncultured Tateyamaria sp.]